MAKNERTYDFKVEGIYYKIINKNRKCVFVTSETGGWNFKSYSESSALPCVTLPKEAVLYTISGKKRYTVKEIGDTAFMGCVGLKSVVIPDSVTKIGFAAFDGCIGLTSVEIPSSVTEIGDQAFAGCTRLKSFQVDPNNDSYCAIDGVLFSKDKKQLVAYPCAKSNEFEIPYGVTEIKGGAFDCSSNLTSITIPDSVTKIGGSAFAFCIGLTSVTIPNSVTKIGCFAFAACTGLTQVTIPDSVTEIGWDAFCECTSLTSVSIGNSVTKIDWTAFGMCRNLKEVICKAVVPPSVEKEAFETYEKLFVPKESLEAYREHKEWGKFKEILPIEE